MSRFVIALLVLAGLLPAGPALAGVCWRPPVAAAVSDPFREPACRWCPGNRGIEYATTRGEAVRAVAAGAVTFAGSVAGTAYVVVTHADGLRATYGNVEPVVAPGDVVVAGSIVGHAAGPVHFGLRQGDTYLDPAPWLGTLVGVPRLIPIEGAPAPAPAPVLRCATPVRTGPGAD
jgi:murein DD-endopeptidase MepM/ murein hydrolase activator NlpD